jgi:iduronate 2-sulfatase
MIACGVLAACALSAPAAPLNVLLIVSDDLRPEMGCYDGDAITPNLDKLAHSNGTVQYDRAYVQQAICCPTRSSFLLGRRPDTTRVWDLKTQFRDAPGGANWKTLPQAFADKGYICAGMGKIFHPVKYKGQTDDIAGGSWNTPYFQPEHSEDNSHPLSQTNCGLGSAVEDNAQYSDGKTAAHAVTVLQNVSKARQPFFVAVGFHRPHLPWVVPSKYMDLYPTDSVKLADHNQIPAHYNSTGAQQWSWDPQSGPRHCQPLYNKTKPPGGGAPTMGEYELVPDDIARHFRRSYFAAVSFLDHNVGIVLDELEALGLHKTTLVAFLGDHGWQLGDLGEFGKKVKHFAKMTT